MLTEQVQQFTLPQPEQLTIPELGGDGIVTVIGLGFGQKMIVGSDPRVALRASLLAAAAVVDDAGEPVMTAEAWDTFGVQHEAQYIKVLEVARRLSGFDSVAAKKS